MHVAHGVPCSHGTHGAKHGEMHASKPQLVLVLLLIGHFTVVCFVTWRLSESEAGGDLVLIQTLLLFTCKSCCSHAN